MTQTQEIIDKLQSLIGIAEKVTEVEADKSLVRRFAQAIGDTNPLWQDEAHATRTRFGGVVAPPHILTASIMSGAGIRPKVTLPFNRTVDGGGEIEFFQPIRPGDKIVSTTKLVDVRVKDGKTGRMVFVSFETIHRNQKNEVLAKSKATIINLE